MTRVVFALALFGAWGCTSLEPADAGLDADQGIEDAGRDATVVEEDAGRSRERCDEEGEAGCAGTSAAAI